MAAAPFLSADYLYCPVCLDVFQEPVTISCGHTFCLTCITKCWSLQGMPTSCPQCRSFFRPESSLRLCKNSILSQIVDDFSKLQGSRERISALNIPGKNMRTQMNPHLQPDIPNKITRNEPCRNLSLPTLYADAQPSHVSQHRVLSQGLADIVRIIQASSFRLLKIMDQAERQLLKTEESHDMEGLAMSVMPPAQVVPDELEDPLQKERPRKQDSQSYGLSAAVAKFKESLLEVCADHMGRLEQQVLGTETSCSISSPTLWESPLLPLIPRVRAEFLQYFREVSLDPGTAHNNLCLTQGNHRVLCKLQPQAYPENPARFDHYTQVLGSEPLGQGRHYWEVHLSGNRVSLGVTYNSISRKGHQSHCLAGRNLQSWCLEWSNTHCYAWHDGQRVLIAMGLKEKLGIFLDWDKGILSFHEVLDDMPLLHQFHASFIQPVFPIFFVSWNSIVSIGEAIITPKSTHNRHFTRQSSAHF